MGFLTHIDIERIKVKYYDPANPMSRIVFKDPEVCIRFDLAIVDNNADPDKRGRIKVRFPHWGDVITDWIPLLRPYASGEAGIWMLPDVGTQVICVFFNDCASRPIVVGSVYTPRAYPPLSDNEENNIKVLTTKSGSKIILDDTDGEEKILIHTKDGGMRLVLDKAKGLSIVNENGDISIKCRKLMIEGKDDTYVTINKDLSITAKNESISKKAKSNFTIKSGKDVILKAKSKINIKGSSGVTAGVKQIAKKDDQVVGVDMHDIKVPTNSGLQTIPMIPHPYLGKLADKLSQDVTINDKAAATKGSKSKFDTPGHICMPPGVKFKKNPNNEGEVSSGTVSNVQINGKDAAVLGSMVKTCNDPQPQETCTIIAVGAPVILPILMPGMDEDQFKKDGGTRFNTATPITTEAKTQQSKKQPKLQKPEWSSDTAVIGEEVTLTVELVDQYDYANVTFTIWADGADKEKDSPEAVLKGQNIDGKAEVKWRYKYIEKSDNPLKEKPKFIFTAKSFRCEKVESGTLEWGQDLIIDVMDIYGVPLKNAKYTLIGPDGKEQEGDTGDNGKIEERNLIPGEYKVLFKKE
ncbi:MAG: hypothetical protein JXJ04_04285 [Spirochaetales bacterium]|nr:hypothetical protein [Spirochaetales bacterium]